MAFISRFVNAKNLENLHPLFCGFKFNFDPRHLRVVHCFFLTKMFAKAASLVYMVSDGKKVASLFSIFATKKEG